ncbi:MAG: hypothetical protein V4710_01490 [Verrucomicrobiota bacterium]
MSTTFLVLLTLPVILCALAFRLFKVTVLGRCALGAILAALALFCGFGFLASYELSEMTQRLPWQIGYSFIGFNSMAAMVFLARPGGEPGSAGKPEAC